MERQPTRGGATRFSSTSGAGGSDAASSASAAAPRRGEPVEDRLHRDWVIKQARTAAKEEQERRQSLALEKHNSRVASRSRRELEAAGENLYRQGMARSARREEMAKTDYLTTPRGMGGDESLRAIGMTNVSRVLMGGANARGGFIARQELFERRRRAAAAAEAERRRVETEEEKSKLHKPRISNMARSIDRTVFDLQAWQEKKRAKVEALHRRKIAEEELRECTFAPRISNASRRMTEGLRARSIHWFPYDRAGVVNADP